MSKPIYIGKMDRPSVDAMTGDDGFVRLECRCFEVDSDALRALLRRHIPRLSMPKQWVLQQRYTQFGRVGQWTFFDHYNTYREALCKASQLLRGQQAEGKAGRLRFTTQISKRLIWPSQAARPVPGLCPRRQCDDVDGDEAGADHLER